MSKQQTLPLFIYEELKKIAKKEGFTEYTITQQAGSNHGDGFLSDVLSTKIKGDRTMTDGTISKSELALVCKLMPANAKRREVFHSDLFFEQEIRVYNEVLPLFLEYQQSKGISKQNGFFSFPKCYYAIGDMATDRFVLIMEDIRQQGFVMSDKLKEMKIEHIKLVFQDLGKFHGLSFAIRDQRPDMLEKLKKIEDVIVPMCVYDTSMDEMFYAAFNRCMALLDDDKVVYKFYKHAKENFKEKYLLQCLTNDASEPFTVFGHGDTWNNNLMFAGENKLCILDWQISRFGSPIIDLTYFIFTTLTKRLRDEHLIEFLDIYYTSLCNIIKLCGSDPQNLFTRDDLNEQFRKFSKFAVLMAPLLLQQIVSDPKNIIDMDTFHENPTGDIAMLDANTEITYKERVRDNVHDALNYGWITIEE